MVFKNRYDLFKVRQDLTMGLHRPLANQPQKTMQILNNHNSYTGQFHFNSLLPYILHTIATFSLYWFPSTNIYITTSILPKVQINIKNSLVFPSSKISTSSSFSLGLFSGLTSLFTPSIHTLLHYAIYKEILSH